MIFGADPMRNCAHPGEIAHAALDDIEIMLVELA